MRWLFENFVIYGFLASVFLFFGLILYQVFLFLKYNEHIIVSMNYFFKKEDLYYIEGWKGISAILNYLYFDSYLSLVIMGFFIILVPIFLAIEGDG